MPLPLPLGSPRDNILAFQLPELRRHEGTIAHAIRH
jgi:hypothetical protein